MNVSVCLSVSPLAHLKDHTSKLHEIFCIDLLRVAFYQQNVIYHVVVGKLHTFEHCKAGFLRYENLRSRAKLLPGGLLKEWRLRQTANEEYVLHVCTQNVYETKRQRKRMTAKMKW